METIKDLRVGDYVFLFFDKSGAIFSARILEKTIRETIDEGLKTEFILETYRQEGEEIVNRTIKFSNSKCKMFATLDELKVELQEHVNNAVNIMLTECEATSNSVRLDLKG